MTREKIGLQFTTGIELFHAWVDDAVIAKRWRIDESVQPYSTQEFIWQRFFNMHAKSIIGLIWWRRHIRMQGEEKTLCYMFCGGDKPIIHDWRSEPSESGIADECPQCRMMAEFYHRKVLNHEHTLP